MRANGVFSQIYKNILQISVTLVNAESIPVTLLVLTSVWPSIHCFVHWQNVRTNLQ